MSETSTETGNDIANIMEKIVSRLSEMPQLNEKLRQTIEDMSDLVKDLKKLIDRSFTENWEFDDFVLQFDWDKGAYIKLPYSKLLIGFVDGDCLRNLPVYECLKRFFSNKNAMIKTVLEQLAKTISDYVDVVEEVLTEKDP